MRTPQSFGYEGSDYPYVVLVGDVGSGKSDIAKILAHPGHHDLNFDESKRTANSSNIFWTYDGSMVICDTPDNRAEEAKLTGNIYLAAALALKPVSQVLIVVRTHPDLDTVMASIRKYSEFLFRLDGFDKVMVGVIFQETDEVSNGNIDEICSQATSNLGIGNTILHSKTILQKENLLKHVKGFCTAKTDIMDDFTKFRKVFVIPDKYLEAQGITNLRDTLIRNQEIRREFNKHRKKWKENINYTNLLFEFQSWMRQRILKDCQKAIGYLAEYYETDLDEELGLHSMVEQMMKLAIYDIYLDTAKRQITRDFDVRRCLFCNEYWTNDDGWDSAICGYTLETRCKSDVLGTFTFRWHNSNKELTVNLSHINEKRENIQISPQFGCGRTIHWQSMPQVDLDPDLRHSLTSKRLYTPQSDGMTTSTKTLLVPPTSTETLLVPPTSTKTLLVPPTSTETLLVPSTSTKPLLVPPTSTETLLVPPSSTETLLVPPTSTETLLVPAQITEHSEVYFHYVVLMGEVGVGKSTVVEKLSGIAIPTGKNPRSVTRKYRRYLSYDKTILVSDTPGCNPIEDQLEHNQQIAAALNYRPVSRILITVKADIRLANVMSIVKKFSERLLDFSDEVIGVLVTHMDSVTWESHELKQKITEEFGIECVLYSGKETPREILLGQITSVCIKPVPIKVDEKKFSRLFKINDKKIKIQKEISKEISQIKEMKRKFDQLLINEESTSKNPMINQFIYWIEKKVKEAENKIITSNRFTFQGENEYIERGYMVDMSNRMKLALRSLYDYERKIDTKQVGRTSLVKYTFHWKNGQLRFNESSSKASSRLSKNETSSIVSGDNGKYDTDPLLQTKTSKEEDRRLVKDMIKHCPLEICVDLNKVGKGKHLLSCDIASFDGKMFLVPRIQSRDKQNAIPMTKVSGEHINSYMKQEDSILDGLNNSWDNFTISIGEVFCNNTDSEKRIFSYPEFHFSSNLECNQRKVKQSKYVERTQSEEAQASTGTFRSMLSFLKSKKKVFEHRKYQFEENNECENTNILNAKICNENSDKMSSKLRITIAPTYRDVTKTGRKENTDKIEVEQNDRKLHPRSCYKQEGNHCRIPSVQDIIEGTSSSSIIESTSSSSRSGTTSGAGLRATVPEHHVALEDTLISNPNERFTDI
ncbi:hypothetical protein ACHWQZ_G007628 [Mnemiopsis leidyi]